MYAGCGFPGLKSGDFHLILDVLVLIVAVFAALAWGANEPWAMAITGAAAAALLAIKIIWMGWKGDLKIPSPSVFIPLILFLAYVLLQWIFWSVEPYSTGLYFVPAFSCVSIMFLSAAGFGSRSDMKRLIVAVVVLGAFEAAYGLVQYLAGYEYIWNYRRTAGPGVATGTLINRNHYALLLNLFISSAAGYLYYRTERILQGESFSIKNIIRFPGTGKLLWILLWIVLMGLALIFSMSRMGIAALFGSIAAMMVTAKSVYSKRRVTVIGSLLIFAIIGLAVYTGVDEVLARYESISDQWQTDRDRMALWADTLPLIRQRPLLGSGLGTFQWTYPEYESVQPDIPAKYAHNDYLQALSEVGAVGLCLLLWTFGALWRIAYRNFRYSEDSLVRGIGLGTIGLLTAVALQEITDFGLYIPGVSIMAALLAGLNLRSREEKHRQLW